MKILLISPTQSGIGGIAQHVQGLANFLKNNGHEVEIISSENTFTIPIKGLKNLSFMISSLIKSKFKKNFDIVHAHNVPSALAMKNISGKKILTIHGMFAQQVEQLHGKTTGSISKKFEADALSWADVITVISKEALEHYSKFGYNTIQIPNGIDPSSFNLCEDRRYKKQIIFAGRLSKEKGTDTLIDICKKLPDDIHMIIVGEGPEKYSIEKISSKKNNIIVLGSQKHKKTISLIKGSDILLQPSLFEGISTTILEAMACKTLVLTTNVGGNTEIIKNNETGILVPVNSSEKFLTAISSVFSNTFNDIKITHNAYEFIKNFDWEIIGKKYLELYKSL